jgi:hypothetical protein
MERNFEVTIKFVVTAEGDDEDSLKDAIKISLRDAIEADEAGEQELEFDAEEMEDF